MTDANYDTIQEIFSELQKKLKEELGEDLMILWGSAKDINNEMEISTGCIVPQTEIEANDILVSRILSGYYAEEELEEEYQPWNT